MNSMTCAAQLTAQVGAFLQVADYAMDDETSQMMIDRCEVRRAGDRWHV